MSSRRKGMDVAYEKSEKQERGETFAFPNDLKSEDINHKDIFPTHSCQVRHTTAPNCKCEIHEKSAREILTLPFLEIVEAR